MFYILVGLTAMYPLTLAFKEYSNNLVMHFLITSRELTRERKKKKKKQQRYSDF